ncbi:MAG TPA: PAS domain S-box protein [Fimbriimonas sp.]|nr:PAS domain S-box protein [Fimbriimonas sp.]
MTRRILNDLESGLSQREHQLLTLASQGLTDQAIAHELAISLATIATYWGRIRIKLGPLNRTELVAKFLGSISQGEIVELQNEIDQLKSKLEATKFDEADMLFTLSKSPDSIMLLDASGAFLYVNEASCALMGYSQQELIGHKFIEFYPKERIHLWEAGFKRVLETQPKAGEMETVTLYVRHKNGVIRVISVNCATFMTQRGLRIIINARVVEDGSH